MALSLKDLKIPAVSIGEVAPHGDVFLRRLSVSDLSKLNKADEPPLPVGDLVTALIGTLLRNGDEVLLTAEQVDALSPEDRARIVAAITAQNQDWFFDDMNEDGDAVDIAKVHVPMARAEGESAEEFLARGYRAEALRMKTRFSTMFKGMSEHLKSVLGPGLAENYSASNRLGEIIKSMQGGMGAATEAHATIRHEPFELRVPPIPRNPIYDTNEILQEVAGQIDQMRELAAATAEMQRTLNDTASTAVADFSSGAEATRKATRNGLWIAGTSLVVSIIALVVTIYMDWGQSNDAQGRDAAQRMRAERAISADREVAARIQLLTEEIARSREATAKLASDASPGREHTSERRQSVPTKGQ